MENSRPQSAVTGQIGSESNQGVNQDKVKVSFMDDIETSIKNENDSIFNRFNLEYLEDLEEENEIE